MGQPVDRELVELLDVSLDALCVAGFDACSRGARW
jgi:hypothetical protein